MAKTHRRSPEDVGDRQAVKAAKQAGVRGEPDVLNSLALPSAFAATTRRAEEAMRTLCTQRTRECRADVAFILANLHLLVDPVPVALASRPFTEDEERAARRITRHLELRARLQQAMGDVRSAQQEHDAELKQLAAHYNQVLTNQIAAWRSVHPHARHLSDLKPAAIDVPDDALDIGQVALVQAARSASGGGEFEWFLRAGTGDVA